MTLYSISPVFQVHHPSEALPRVPVLLRVRGRLPGGASRQHCGGQDGGRGNDGNVQRVEIYPGPTHGGSYESHVKSASIANFRHF